MVDSVRGKFNNDDVEVKLDISGDDIVVGRNEKSVFFKIPLKSLFSKMEQTVKRYRQVSEISEDSLKNVLRDGSASLQIKAKFDIELSAPYSYGEDADGNRGTTRRDYEGVLSDSFEFLELKLFIFDEDGNNLDPHDDSILVLDASEKHQELKDYIIETVDRDPSDYAE